MKPDWKDRLDRAFDQLRQWSLIWGYSLLPRTLNLEFLPEDSPDLGQCQWDTQTIRLNPKLLLPEHEDLLLETLCHEAAHWMAFRRHGLGIDPHGPEWQGFMRQAGYEPRARTRYRFDDEKLRPATIEAYFELNCDSLSLKSTLKDVKEP